MNEARIRLDRRDPARRLLGRFAVSSLLPLVLLGVVLGHTLNDRIRTRALESAKGSAQVAARLGILPMLSPSDIENGLSPRRILELDDALHTSLIGQEVATIRIWAPEGRVVYSDDHSLIGRTFGENHELEEALEGEIEAEMFDPSKADADPTLGLHERYGGLLEVYVPLVFGEAEEPAGAFELYLPYGPIASAIATDSRRLYVIVGLGLLLLWLLLLPIAHRTGRVLRDQALRLEELLSRERETVRRLQELDRMKSDFVSTASHELRSPLTSIIGFAKTLRQPQHGGDHEIREEFLGRMERQGERLLRLVDQLLQTALLQGPRGAPERAPFDFAAVARETAASVDDGRREFRFDLPVDLPQLVSDRTMVGHILAGLIGNAVKYSPAGGTCTVGARADTGAFRFWVQDEGVGMTPEELEHVFEPFWQADSSATRETGGVGLGLHLVKQVAAALDGTVLIESKVGEGTRCTVTLPNVTAGGADPAASQPRALADVTG